MSVAGVVAALLGRCSSLSESFGLRSLILNAPLGLSNLDHATIPLHVVATDIERAEVLLSRGPALAGLLASTAIPGILPPVDIGGRALVDGGVLANVPLLEADALGAVAIRARVPLEVVDG
jgi:NTE family protein